MVRSRDNDPDETAATRMIHHLGPAFESLTDCADVVVVEGQQIYFGKSAATPDSILALALVSGCLVAYANTYIPRAKILIPKPQQWKGQVPKDIGQARSYTLLGLPFDRARGYSFPTPGAAYDAIQGAEHVNKGDWEHLGDAAGLALWGLQNANAKVTA